MPAPEHVGPSVGLMCWLLMIRDQARRSWLRVEGSDHDSSYSLA